MRTSNESQVTLSEHQVTVKWPSSDHQVTSNCWLNTGSKFLCPRLDQLGYYIPNKVTVKRPSSDHQVTAESKTINNFWDIFKKIIIQINWFTAICPYNCRLHTGSKFLCPWLDQLGNCNPNIALRQPLYECLQKMQPKEIWGHACQQNNFEQKHLGCRNDLNNVQYFQYF